MLDWLLAASAVVACDVATQPLIAAHRGGMDSGHPENTLPAFVQAASAGADVVELDLRTTADGEVVVMHDSRVDRTTNGSGPIRDLNLAAVKRLDTGNGVTVPTLVEVLEQARSLDVTLLFDVKRSARLDHDAVVAAARTHYDLDRVVFGVRSLEDRAAFAKAHPQLRFLGFVPLTYSIDAFLEAGVEAIRLWPGWVRGDPGLIRRVHERGARVWITTDSDSLDELTALVQLGIDALLTDYPAAAAGHFHCR